jgi:1,4-dihydroxy-6-naphthoate synthase
VILEDVEKLNRMAFAKELDVTKSSFHAYAYVLNNYILLKSGSALGFNCGPILIAKKKMVMTKMLWKCLVQFLENTQLQIFY